MKASRHLKKKSNQSERFWGIIARYLTLILVAIPNLWVFYFIFTPLTLYLVYFLLSFFFNVNIFDNIILINGKIPIELIKACIAGSAYYLLLILNLSVPGIKIGKRIRMILLSFAVLLTVNTIRIFLLAIIFIRGYSFFDAVHLFFWYVMSIAFVIAIWFVEVKLFKVKGIPVYSDLKFLVQAAKKKH